MLWEYFIGPKAQTKVGPRSKKIPYRFKLGKDKNKLQEKIIVRKKHLGKNENELNFVVAIFFLYGAIYRPSKNLFSFNL